MAEDIVGLYDAGYGGFERDVYAEVRHEAFGDDIGQSSWLTREELDGFAASAGVQASSRVLEVASGSGGPALYLARSTGCSLVGIDFNEHGVANSLRLAREAGVESRVRFVHADASQSLEFDAASFTHVLCIDAVNHLAGRAEVLTEWWRVLEPGGRLLFTDPITITGILGTDEIAARASIGFMLFAPHGEDERLLRVTGFEVLGVDDVTENMAELAARWRDARAAHEVELRGVEGDESFDGQQRFLTVASDLARERRLSRFVYLAQKPH